MADALPLLKGTLDVLILKVLSWGPQHGFGIATWLEERSGGVLGVEDGALYQALHRMEERDLIESEWGVTENSRRARYYSITRGGREHLQEEAARLTGYAAALTSILLLDADG